MGLGNKEVHNYGHRDLNIKIDNKQFQVEAHITDVYNKLYDGLLGLDFLEKHEGAIDIAARTLRLNGIFYPLTSVAEEEARHVFVCRGLATPENTQKNTWATLRL